MRALGRKLSKAKYNLRYFATRVLKCSIFRVVSTHAAIKQLKSSATNNRKEITCMETLTQQKTMQQPILVPPGGGEKLNIAGSPISHNVKSKDTNGALSVIEFVTPPGKGVAVHI